MRIFLTRPNSIIVPTPVPLGLGYIAGKLRKERGDTIKIVDGRNLRWPIAKLQQAIREFKPDVIGLSAINFEAPETHELAAAARAECPKAPIILGGPYASANQQSILQDPNIDIVVHGEGEITVLELINAIENGDDLERVKGIIYRKNGEAVCTAQRELISDLDSLECAWDLIDPQSYFKRKGRNSENIIKHDYRCLTVFTSRGCPYGCIFCHNVFGKRFRPRSAESVLEEISMLKDRYGIRELEFVDDSFNQSISRAKEICQGMVERGLQLHCALPNGIRGDRTDDDFLDLLKAAGFYRISFAVESASPRMQKIINKNIDLNKVKWSIEQVAKRGLVASGFFIMGFPTETYEEMMLTADWAAASDLHVASFFYLNPFPGTKVAEMAGCDFTKVDFRDYTTRSVNISAATDEELFAANRYAYRRFYMSPRRILRGLKVVPKNFRNALNVWYVFRLLLQDSVNQ